MDEKTLLLKEVQKQTELLFQIKNLLEQEKKSLAEGLGPCDRPTNIFIGWEGDKNWYMRPGEANVGCPFDCLKGYVMGLVRWKKVHEKYGESIKCDLKIKGDKDYLVRSSLESIWTRKILLTIPHIDQGKPVLIAPKRGDEDNVVFCQIEQEGLPAVDWDKETNAEVLWMTAELSLVSSGAQIIELKAAYGQDLVAQAWERLPERKKSQIRSWKR